MPVPEQTYFPSAKIRLTIRFDEFGSSAVAKQVPPKPQTVLRGTGSARAPLQVTPDPAAPPGVSRLLVAPAGAIPTPGGPQEQTGSSDGLTWTIAGIIPARMSWQQNGIRTADTLTATFRFIDCPIDPRTIRSCAVETYLGTVDQESYARGIAGETRASQIGQSCVTEPLNIIPDTWTDSSGQARTNLRFQGWVDKWTIAWSDDDEPTIELECRDNTALLIEVEAPPALVVSAARPIDRAIADYLANFPNFAGLSVEYRPAGATPPQLGLALAGTSFQPHLGPVASRTGGAQSIEKLSIWDYLTDVCGAVGHNIRVEGTTVVIEQVQTLLSNKTTRRASDPFQGRTLDGDTWQQRRFIWGRNLHDMKFSRNFSKHAPTNVEVRCYSTRRKKTLVVRFPDPQSQTDKLVAYALPGEAKVDQKWVVWKVRGVEDVATLKLIAQNVYQTIGRNEFTLDIETMNLASFGGGNLDPDILDTLVGDAFEILVARDDSGGSVDEVEDSLMRRGQEMMQNLGFDAGLAAAYARAYTDAGFQTLFRLKQMRVDWDADDRGVTISMMGVNYVEVRVDKPFEES